MDRQRLRLVAWVLVALAGSGCAAGRAFDRGEDASRAGDWDAAVAHYTKAVQADPEKPEYKIALERAAQRASAIHLDRAKALDSQDQLDAALLEYKKAAEYYPGNTQAAARAVQIEQIIRDRIEASKPKAPITEMRERARLASAQPVLNPASREPLNIRFTNAGLRDILNFIANATGINITYDPGFQDRAYTVQLDGVTLEQGLNQILTANTLFYKVLNERTIIVVPDTPANRAKYEEQVIRTFFISHGDATEVAQIINTVIRSPGMAVQPLIAPNKSANTITVRATAAVVAIIEQLISTNDRPRAEVIVDVEILEVDRTRAKEYGLNLTQYAVGSIFSPEVAPRATTGDGTGDGTDTGTGTGVPPTSVTSPPVFNFNTITRGISAADFYLAVPAAIVRFLESDSQTKIIAKPQLRGAEGNKLTLNLGQEVPVPSTAFTPIAGGGANINPLTSFNYRPVGVNVEITPRVTHEGDILVEMSVETSDLGDDKLVAGVLLPTFISRKVTTRLRLRDGESNLLAGLIQERVRKSISGFPGAIHVPVLKQLFSSNNNRIEQTDIVMLLTPRVVRTHELTQKDLNPIYIGTQQNLGLSGPPPLIAPPAPVPPEGAAPGPSPIPPPGAVPGVPGPPAGAAPGVPGATPPAEAAPVAPPGTSGVPGTTVSPAGAPAYPPGTTAVPGTTTPAIPGAAVTQAQVLVTAPGTEFRVAGGPYTVPISITGASRIATISIALTFNQAALRVRTVQEGSFMRQGGGAVTFTQQVDSSIGRVDITLARTADATGASGTGLLAAVMFDAVAPGAAPFTISGVATDPGGTQMPLQFIPTSVTVR